MDDAATIAKRLLDGDTSLWPKPNVAGTRLGWVDIAPRMQRECLALKSWAESVERSHIVLIGMGGSSLGPEVLRAALGSGDMLVLDTTEPATVDQMTDDLSQALIVVSSKSGSTLEIQALLTQCWEQQSDPGHYVAITDPGTELDKLATDREFGRIFRNDPNIGGRYSALSHFGLVPAALLGYDPANLLTAAMGVDTADAVKQGAEMALAALSGHDKATIRVPPDFAEFGMWVEQLIAESLGKHGKGVIPVPTFEPEPGADRHQMAARISVPNELGAAFMRWEIAVAAAGHVLEVDPFDEPNVAESKANTKRVLDNLPLPQVDTADPDTAISWLRGQVNEGDYVSLQAYSPYGDAFGLEQARRRVRDALGGVAATAGFGPRFLHSTGQLHKGGPNSVVAVQIVPRSPRRALPVPDFGYDFGTLIDAQAIGDYQSLVQHGRRVLRIAADDFAEIN